MSNQVCKDGTSALLVQSGLTEKWWRETLESSVICENTGQLADGKCPCERCGSRFDESRQETNVVFINLAQKCFQEDSWIRPQFWRRLDQRLDHRGLARHRESITSEVHVNRLKVSRS